MNAIQIEESVREARGLVSLFERRMITQNSLVSGIAGIVTPENFQHVMDALPDNVRAQMRRWAESLHDAQPGEIIFWPLKQGVDISFRKWLQDQEASGNGSANN